MQTIYLVRHCRATGQAIEAPLTEEGVIQAKQLKDFFKDKKIKRTISSPFVRAVESIKPLAETQNLHIEIDERLSERVLAEGFLANWYELLKQSFEDLDMTLDGGESSNNAMNRARTVLDELVEQESDDVVLVSHGNLLALLLHSIDESYGFKEWENLSNPDVFKVEIEGSQKRITRIWD